MSKHLTKDGNLTQSQLEEADRLNIPHDKFTQIVLKRLADSFTPNDNDVNIECMNPVIIVGHGAGWQVQLKKIRHTKIPIISVDICSISMMSEDIIPTYITTLEEATKRINETLFNFEKINNHKITIVGSKITKEWMVEACDKWGINFLRNKNYNSSRCCNVGVFTALFARDVLKSDKIIMIGMNSWADDDGNPYLNWYTDWRHFIIESPEHLLVNCTQGGLIYGDKVLSSDFNRLYVNGK